MRTVPGYGPQSIQADDDEWRRAYRGAIAVRDRDPVRLKALAAAPEAATQPPVILSGLCGSLLIHNLRAEVQTVLSEAQRRHPDDFWINYLLGHFWDQERPQVAVGYFRAAVAIRPTSDQAYSMLARALRNMGDADGAIDAYRSAISLNSNSTLVKELAKLLAPRGRLEEARVDWEKLLEGKPTDHQSWYGYAQLCLFLGNERAYKVARKAILDQFGNNADDWFIAERTSLACLLLPLDGDDLRRTVEMVERAEAAGPNPPILTMLTSSSSKGCWSIARADRCRQSPCCVSRRRNSPIAPAHGSCWPWLNSSREPRRKLARRYCPPSRPTTGKKHKQTTPHYG